MSKGRGLLRSLGYGTLQTLVRLVLGFASIKVTAVVLGPAGLALVAQVNNFINWCQGTLANGGATAVLKHGAIHKDDPTTRQRFMSSTLWLVVGLTVLCGVLVCVASPWLADELLHDRSKAAIFWFAAIAIIAAGVMTIVTTGINAINDLGRLIRGNIAVAVAGFVFFVAGTYLWGIGGALIGSCLGYVAGMMITLAVLRFPRGELTLKDFIGRFDRSTARSILAFYPMLIVHAGLGSLSIIVVRSIVASGPQGLDGAGLWQASWRLSEQYLSILTASISIYFVPKISALIDSRAAFRREILATIRNVAAISAGMAALIYVFRDQVVWIIFSSKFKGVTDLIPVQLLGDVLKMAGWIPAMVLTTLVRQRQYIALEIVVPIVFVGATWLLMDATGIKAANYAYVLAGLVQLLLGLFFVRDVLRRAQP